MKSVLHLVSLLNYKPACGRLVQRIQELGLQISVTISRIYTFKEHIREDTGKHMEIPYKYILLA